MMTPYQFWIWTRAAFGLPPEVRIYLTSNGRRRHRHFQFLFFRSNIFYDIRLALHGLRLRSFAANFKSKAS